MSTTWSWVLVFLAGLFEVCWAVGLKYTQGFTKLGPTIFTVSTLAISMYLLAVATKSLPIGTAYGVWVGIGSLGAALLGIVLFGEAATPSKLFFLGLLLISIIGLRITAG